jgi:hypothetical protein
VLGCFPLGFKRAVEQLSRIVSADRTKWTCLQHIDGVSFDEVWENKIEGLVDGEIRMVVISKDDVIRNQLASGREQDILDVKKLRASALEDPSNH